MKQASSVKLSKKQKEVILAMREKVDVFRWVGTPICKFTFKGKTFRYDLGCGLQRMRLIEAKRSARIDHFYQLTELGKTIAL